MNNALLNKLYSRIILLFTKYHGLHVVVTNNYLWNDLLNQSRTKSWAQFSTWLSASVLTCTMYGLILRCKLWPTLLSLIWLWNNTFKFFLNYPQSFSFYCTFIIYKYSYMCMLPLVSFLEKGKVGRGKLTPPLTVKPPPPTPPSHPNQSRPQIPTVRTVHCKLFSILKLWC